MANKEIDVIGVRLAITSFRLQGVSHA